MTQVPSSLDATSLKEMLHYQSEYFFSSFPTSLNSLHPHQTFLTWLLTKTHPQKIAIFDNTEQGTQAFFCNLVQSLTINSECYSNISQFNNPLQINTLIPLTPEIDFTAFSVIYIDISNDTIKSNPLLSFAEQSIPADTTFVFNNLYCQNSIAKQNRYLINQWKIQYPFLEFSHHQGLVILHTGVPTCKILNELFALKNTPKLEYAFKRHCAVIDEYWRLKLNSNIINNINTKKQIVEAKTETYLLQQDIYYREKALQKTVEKSEETAQERISALQEKLAAQHNQLNASTQELQKFDDALRQFTLWKENTQEKLKSIEYLLEKYRFITFFFPKKLRQLLTFLPAPELPLPDKEHRNIDPLILDSAIESPLTREESVHRPCHIIFIAGEPNTPGVVYRCHRNAAACIMAGHKAKVIHAADISPQDIEWADILILWRVEFSGHILGIIELAKEYNTLTAFDADDIVFKPHFAYIEIIDGIRTIGTTEAETSRTFGNMKQTLMRTDFAVATTQEMRVHMAQELIPKHAGPLVFTLPNIFDDDCVRISRFFSRINKAHKDDNYIRIGYASGTRTHQRDFALVIPALLSIFKKRPQVRLVLFREPDNHRPILHMNEFPELNDFQDRIEWRDTVPLKQLPQELARLDISIAPLEADNVFCNAKSELKFFEAALANVCSVVSPTGPLTRCIQHEVTGFLAKNTEEWEEYLLKLIDDPSLRQQMARDAYHDVLWNFSIQRQSRLCDTMLLSLTGEKGAAQAMETMIARKEYKNLSMPIIPESELLFDHDALQEAEVTVVITSYNYSQFIIEAMESVRAQTLKHIDMIIVDDGSADDSVDLIIAWAEEHKNRFNRLQLHRSLKNTGLGGARNIGIAASETLYSMQLDADNRLLPNTCEKLLEKIKNTAIGYAYPHLRHFGAGEAIGGHVPFHPLRLTVGNYIDAMVMLAKWAWTAVGGYYVQRDAMGWEDYDIWCRLAELGIQGTQAKDAIAEYRAHFSSMTSTVTEQTYHKPKVTSYLAERHPWIKLVLPEESPWIKKKNNE
ncbi:Glycosyltransferase involved in cell wall bisynthesis (RfaB) (PDB:2IV7) [Commensalibacter communis]|uniref:glycosyltransferase n=1 Tax=Commensalibacter communis TaxID=2972786 RepID=UPI0022FF8B69|nr:glycosyltransferase [Commensalibacter communis]CAI3954577.1 Glycosyltransferase involved in cell wall bisynthesis (RfaB) (PDB:2IV7) [Commensalibacter communis]